MLQPEEFTDVTYVVEEDAYAIVTINRPERYNSFRGRTVDELIAAENGLTQRQAELDSLTAQLEWLDSQVSMSTLNVSFSTDVDSTGFSLGKAWQIFLKSLEVVGYGLLVALPWLVVAAIIFLLVRWGLAKRWAKLAAGTTNVDEVDAANTDPETLDVEVVEAEDAP